MAPRLLIPLFVLAAIFAAPKMCAQTPRVVQEDPWCEHDRDSGGTNGERHCEVREIVMPAKERAIEIDGGMNGGMTVLGWDRDEIRIRAKVVASARTESAARELAEKVAIRTTGQRIRAEGPKPARRSWFSVSYEVMVPHESDLSLETHNGGLRIADVSGHIRFSALNGGVQLSGLSGDVSGSTTNGALDVELVGSAWDGHGMDVRTTNGAVRLVVPDGYSAQLETGTVNGVIDVDFPVTVQGRIGKRVEAQLGDGGPTIRAQTTNGRVEVSKG